jgi:Zn-dependent M28 family amino/carboxypeptidase
VKADYLTYGPGADNVQGNLVKVSNVGCDAADFPAGVSGNVAFISRGTCTFAIKAANAKTAGASAAIIYNNVPLQPLSGTLGGDGDYAPVVGVTQEIGNELLAKMGNSTAVPATVFIETIRENRTNYNVIAETKGGDKNNVLMIGGHTDSVFAGQVNLELNFKVFILITFRPGINDDGSGTIGVLVVAEALSKYKLKNAVRLGFWGAEEVMSQKLSSLDSN